MRLCLPLMPVGSLPFPALLVGGVPVPLNAPHVALDTCPLFPDALPRIRFVALPFALQICLPLRCRRLWNFMMRCGVTLLRCVVFVACVVVRCVAVALFTRCRCRCRVPSDLFVARCRILLFRCRVVCRSAIHIGIVLPLPVPSVTFVRCVDSFVVESVAVALERCRCYRMMLLMPFVPLRRCLPFPVLAVCVALFVVLYDGIRVDSLAVAFFVTALPSCRFIAGAVRSVR